MVINGRDIRIHNIPIPINGMVLKPHVILQEINREIETKLKGLTHVNGFLVEDTMTINNINLIRVSFTLQCLPIPLQEDHVLPAQQQISGRNLRIFDAQAELLGMALTPPVILHFIKTSASRIQMHFANGEPVPSYALVKDIQQVNVTFTIVCLAEEENQQAEEEESSHEEWEPSDEGSVASEEESVDEEVSDEEETVEEETSDEEYVEESSEEESSEEESSEEESSEEESSEEESSEEESSEEESSDENASDGEPNDAPPYVPPEEMIGERVVYSREEDDFILDLFRQRMIGGQSLGVYTHVAAIARRSVSSLRNRLLKLEQIARGNPQDPRNRMTPQQRADHIDAMDQFRQLYHYQY